ncbi:uncharacterized protein BDZ99DRAFT_567730 [Mytilinidion resinicola]|uniref:Uncharacterized protein n=1 Tax=Mytilinidion resinicola TaxID=574789 RepID=A0A6A6Z1I4_9PEZI|nr:uncharacterized protein BDZ99DRAFT_567730 [Mytilinidion resinicola]KAF2814035.1 hypothetical protein BDZ99DRAFT_567730 [Mytilinidion resinicola]
MAKGKYTPLTLSPVNFSLTEGTSIPAPPDSPPDTPRPPTPGKGPLSSHPTPSVGTFAEATAANGKSSTEGGLISPTPLSPTQSSLGKRPSSVRKFLGLRTLSSSDSLRSTATDRPGSPSTVDSRPSLNRKKSGSWFGRRKSAMFVGRVEEGSEKENAAPRMAPVPEKKGPPPPALPELKSLGVSEEAVSMGADDMFKDIK